MSSIPFLSLNDGRKIPALGLGTWQSTGGSAYDAVKWALEAGYRHIDTAAIYGNESEVGKVIADSDVARKDLFVTTKLWNADQTRGKDACRDSLKRLGLDYVDLYLIHWPQTGSRLAAWDALVELREAGLCKSIGVSNFTIRHLEELAAHSKVVPAINQVEYSPFLNQESLLGFCKRKKIVVTAYSPLSRGQKISHPAIASIAKALGKTPAQVMLRWALQKGMAVIPKSVHKERILENSRVFDFSLSAKQMAELDSLNEDFRTCWNPEEMK